jgi:hypothetical protein
MEDAEPEDMIPRIRNEMFKIGAFSRNTAVKQMVAEENANRITRSMFRFSRSQMNTVINVVMEMMNVEIVNKSAEVSVENPKYWLK